MPLLARKEVERTKALSVRLPESVLGLLDDYARHVNADRLRGDRGAALRVL
jgi:hypothetical protein